MIIVDQGGVPCDLDPVRELCDPLGVTVVEDAACGAGSTYRDRPVGAGAEVTAWSFHPRKILTTGEGGMLTTSRPEWAERARTLREHAMSVSAAERHQSVLPPPESYPEIGFNYRMTDLQAAVGIVQLGRLDEVVARRRALAAALPRGARRPRGTAPGRGPATRHDQLPVAVARGRRRLPARPRRAPRRTSREHDISARRGIMAAHRQPAYAGSDHGPLPVTERLTDHTLILPLFHQMTDEEQDRVVEAIRAAAVPGR